jgi:hypothetical protein
VFVMMSVLVSEIAPSQANAHFTARERGVQACFVAVGYDAGGNARRVEECCREQRGESN